MITLAFIGSSLLVIADALGALVPPPVDVSSKVFVRWSRVDSPSALRSGRPGKLTFGLRLLSEFERDVLDAASRIPVGETRPDNWIAAQIARPRAVRAVGLALGRNPVVNDLLPHIRFFRIDVSWLQAVFKLSQGRDPADIQAQIRALRQRPTGASWDLANLMAFAHRHDDARDVGQLDRDRFGGHVG